MTMKKQYLNGSFNKAVNIYKSQESKEWIERMRFRYLTELDFADAISEHFSIIMQTFPIYIRKVLALILETYDQGITSKDISERLFISEQSVGVAIGKLRDAKIINSSHSIQDSRLMLHYVPDKDWLFAYAVKSDTRFLHWRDKTKSDSISDFILDLKEGKVKSFILKYGG